MTHDSAEMNEHTLIYDWNGVDKEPAAGAVVEFDDETLRDGLQSPSVTDPTIDEKIHKHILRHSFTNQFLTTKIKYKNITKSITK